MKHFIYAIAIMAAAISLLTACDKEEEESYVPGPYSWDFGYIKGTLNGTDISLQNEGGQWGKHIPAAGAIYSVYESPKKFDSYGTTIPITRRQDELIYGFTFHITPVKVGIVEIKSPNHELIHNSIHFIDERDDENKKSYAPLKQPLELHITRADFSNESSVPFIEGVMDGVLYNEKNLNDSIIVKNVEFGVHG